MAGVAAPMRSSRPVLQELIMATPLADPIPAPRNRAENRVYRRDSLIRSAIAVVGRHDLTGATVERICHGAGASRGLIAHYFDSKEALLIAAAGETFDAQAMAVKEKLADDESLAPDERLRRMAASSFEAPIFSHDAIAAWQAFTNASRHDPAFREITQSVARNLILLYAPLFEAAGRDRGIAVDGRIAALGLINLVEGLWNSLAMARDGLTPEAATRIAQAHIDGCLVGSASQ